MAQAEQDGRSSNRLNLRRSNGQRFIVVGISTSSICTYGARRAGAELTSVGACGQRNVVASQVARGKRGNPPKSNRELVFYGRSTRLVPPGGTCRNPRVDLGLQKIYYGTCNRYMLNWARHSILHSFLVRGTKWYRNEPSPPSRESGKQVGRRRGQAKGGRQTRTTTQLSPRCT